jgi:hypothetical protein
MFTQLACLTWASSSRWAPLLRGSGYRQDQPGRSVPAAETITMFHYATARAVSRSPPPSAQRCGQARLGALPWRQGLARVPLRPEGFSSSGIAERLPITVVLIARHEQHG